MRSAPFLLVILILVGGAFAAYQSYTAPVESSDLLAERPTVTPRPLPTSPPTNVPRSDAAFLPTVQPTRTATATLPTLAATSVPPAPTATPTRVRSNPTAERAATLMVRQPTPVTTPVRQRTPTPEPAATATPTIAPTPDPAANSGDQMILRVGNTDGEGVYQRRTPRMEDKIRPWRDGTPMVIVGPAEVGDGQTWNHVRAPDGTEGYIPVQYLIN